MTTAGTSAANDRRNSPLRTSSFRMKHAYSHEKRDYTGYIVTLGHCSNVFTTTEAATATAAAEYPGLLMVVHTLAAMVTQILAKEHEGLVVHAKRMEDVKLQGFSGAVQRY